MFLTSLDSWQLPGYLRAVFLVVFLEVICPCIHCKAERKMFHIKLLSFLSKTGLELKGFWLGTFYLVPHWLIQYSITIDNTKIFKLLNSND